MSNYIGVEPVPQATRVLTEGVLAASSQVISVPGGFAPGNIYVYINGSRLAQNGYDDSDGFSVDLGTELPADTEYVIEEVRTFRHADHYTKGESDGRYPKLSGANDFDTMPTVGGDPIVESGSNSDGEWTRWADGIQLVRSPEFRIDTTESVGALYRTTMADRPRWTYPAPFLVEPEHTFLSFGSTFRWGNMNTQIDGADLQGLSAVSEVNAPCYGTVIGRWK